MGLHNATEPHKDKRAHLIEAQLKEEQRLKQVLAPLGEEQLELIAGQIQNAAWLKVQLDKQRQEIGATSSTYAKSSDKGDIEIKRNPMFSQYKTLNDSYNATMKILFTMLTRSAAKNDDDQLAQWIQSR